MTNKPLVKLLRSPNGEYFYDVNRNEIVPIQKESYDYLEKLLEGSESKSTSEVPSEISQLEMSGYLSGNHVKTIEHFYTPFLKDMLKNDLGSLCLQVTQNCNLRCEYCIYSESKNEKQRAHSSGRMSEGTMMRAIDYLQQHSQNAQRITVSFYGGEPLLEFNLIKKAILYAEEEFEGRPLTFNITTNGTLLTKEVADFLFSHNTNISISLDGPKQIHDQHRRMKSEGSFDRLMHNMNYIVNSYPNEYKHMNISMVIDPQNSFNEIISVFDQYPFLREMTLMYSVIDDIYSNESNCYSAQYITESQYHSFLGILYELNQLDKDALSAITATEVDDSYESIQKFRPSVTLGEKGAPTGPCLTGHRRLFCDIHGNLFPCERVSEKSKIMNIGTLDSGIDSNKCISIINVAQSTAAQCKDCWAFQFCHQCIRTADGGDHIDSSQRLSHCKNSRQNAEHFLNHLILLDEARRLY